MRPSFLLVLFFHLVSSSCHYSCATCTTPDYYSCLTCKPNRGAHNMPTYGMCYCAEGSDQDDNGNCTNNMNKSYTTAIIVVISFSLLFGLLTSILKQNRYFLLKVFQDIQEMSLILLINLYFPLQLDNLLTVFYNFNLSSYTFQALAIGSLFTVSPDQSVNLVDGQNVYGKYKLLHKSGNFLANQLTWIIIGGVVAVGAVTVRAVRNHLKNKRDRRIVKQAQAEANNESMYGMRKEVNKKPIKQPQVEVNNESMYEMQKEVNKKPIKDSKKYTVANTIYNVYWYNLLIYFFYFSLIEININVFTQISNLTFSSPLASIGAFTSALFLGLQLIIATLLCLKTQEEVTKPEWMRDYAYSACYHMIRTNYKSLAKYFWFVSVVKKVILALAVTTCYATPVLSITAVACIHALYLFTAIYCEPFQRRHIRMHFYFTQGMKMFIYLALVDFANKYTNYVELIAITNIVYGMLVTLFTITLVWLILTLCIERKVYWNKVCKDTQVVTGYNTIEKMYVYKHPYI